jgi:hypothetical protein
MSENELNVFVTFACFSLIFADYPGKYISQLTRIIGSLL